MTSESKKPPRWEARDGSNTDSDGKLSLVFYHRMEGLSMLALTELFFDKLEWNCQQDAMWADYHEDEKDDEDDEE